MDNPIRILHVLGRLDRGGAETMVMNIYRNIDRSKVQFDFVIHSSDECDYSSEIRDLGGKIHTIARYTGKNHFAYKKSWNEFFKQNANYKIVHGHMRSTASLYLGIARKHGVTTIAHSHNTSSGQGISAVVKNILQYNIKNNSDYFFACSQMAGEWLFGKEVCKADNFHIIKNAIDTRQYVFSEKSRNKIRKEFDIEGKFVIGHIGRFHEQKNHEFLLKVFESLCKFHDDAVLLLCGDGTLKDSIEQSAHMSDLNNKVIFTGVRSDIPELLQAMDVFVFPSQYEGLGIVLIEAQAAGLHCLASDTVPKEAFITDNVEAMSLKESQESWAIKVLDFATCYERKNLSDIIIESGYDILETSKWVQSFYIRKWKNE